MYRCISIYIYRRISIYIIIGGWIHSYIDFSRQVDADADAE